MIDDAFAGSSVGVGGHVYCAGFTEGCVALRVRDGGACAAFLPVCACNM